MVIGQIVGIGTRLASQAFRASGAKAGGKALLEFNRFDRRIHRRVLGRSGGSGFRHGRDIGLAGSGELRNVIYEKEGARSPPGQFDKTRRRYSDKRGVSAKNRRSACRVCRRSNTCRF